MPKLGIDESELDKNSWLAGFTDADGNFSISLSTNSKKHRSRVNLSYRLEIRQNYDKENNINNKNNYYEIMIKIATLFNSELYSRERNLKLKNQLKSKIYRSYIVSINSLINLWKVRDYFNEYPLLSSKYLDYKDWESVLIAKKDNISNEEILIKSKKIRTNLNSTRLDVTWDHLKNNKYEIY